MKTIGQIATLLTVLSCAACSKKPAVNDDGDSGLADFTVNRTSLAQKVLSSQSQTLLNYFNNETVINLNIRKADEKNTKCRVTLPSQQVDKNGTIAKAQVTPNGCEYDVEASLKTKNGSKTFIATKNKKQRIKVDKVVNGKAQFTIDICLESNIQIEDTVNGQKQQVNVFKENPVCTTISAPTNNDVDVMIDVKFESGSANQSDQGNPLADLPSQVDEASGLLINSIAKNACNDVKCYPKIKSDAESSAAGLKTLGTQISGLNAGNLRGQKVYSETYAKSVKDVVSAFSAKSDLTVPQAEKDRLLALADLIEANLKALQAQCDSAS